MQNEPLPIITVFVPVTRNSNLEVLDLALFSLSGQSFDKFEVLLLYEFNPWMNQEPHHILRNYPFNEFTISKSKSLHIPSFEWESLASVFELASGDFFLWMEENSVFYTHALESLFKARSRNQAALTIAGTKKSLLKRDGVSKVFHAVSKRNLSTRSHTPYEAFVMKAICTSSILVDRNQVLPSFKWTCFSSALSFNDNWVLSLLAQFKPDTELFTIPLCESLFFSIEQYEDEKTLPLFTQKMQIPCSEIQRLVLENEQLRKVTAKRTVRWALKLSDFLKSHPKTNWILTNIYSSLHKIISTHLFSFSTD